MYGVDVYRLSVYTKTYENGGWTHLIDFFPQDINTVWYRASVPLGSQSDPYKVKIILKNVI